MFRIYRLKGRLGVVYNKLQIIWSGFVEDINVIVMLGPNFVWF